jgi:hypothetical protein
MRLHLFIELLISPYSKMRTRGEKYFYGCLHNDDQQLDAQWNFFSLAPLTQSCFVLSKHGFLPFFYQSKLRRKPASPNPFFFIICLISSALFARGRKMFIKISNKN